MNAEEKLDITPQAKRLITDCKMWFVYTPERFEYLKAKVIQLTGIEPRIMPQFGTLNGKPIAEIRFNPTTAPTR